MEDQLQLWTAIYARYQVFDRSGRLSFGINFGLCRRSNLDTDPRPLTLDVTNSALDVPYGLANKLLILHKYDEESSEWIEEDIHVGSLGLPETKNERYLTVSPPVERAGHWMKAFATYHYEIDANSKLAAYFEVGNKYEI